MTVGGSQFLAILAVISIIGGLSAIVLLIIGYMNNCDGLLMFIGTAILGVLVLVWAIFGCLCILDNAFEWHWLIE